jgi:hypothetical protein
MPSPLYPQGKSPRYPLHRRLGRPQNRSGRGYEEKNLRPYRELKPGRIAHSLVTLLTELPVLRNSYIVLGKMQISRDKYEHSTLIIIIIIIIIIIKSWSGVSAER